MPMLELYYKLSNKFCGVELIEVLEIDTDCLYLSRAHDNLYRFIRQSNKN